MKKLSGKWYWYSELNFTGKLIHELFPWTVKKKKTPVTWQYHFRVKSVSGFTTPLVSNDPYQGVLVWFLQHGLKRLAESVISNGFTLLQSHDQSAGDSIDFVLGGTSSHQSWRMTAPKDAVTSCAWRLCTLLLCLDHPFLYLLSEQMDKKLFNIIKGCLLKQEI